MILQAPPELISPIKTTSPIISTLIHGQLDRFRESAEPQLRGPPNPIQLYYHHTCLLIRRLPSSSYPYNQDLLDPATRIAKAVNEQGVLSSPFSHHLAALSLATLRELGEAGNDRDAVRNSLYELTRAMSAREANPQRWDHIICQAAREAHQRISHLEQRQGSGIDGVTTKAGAASGLQHLADAAVGGVDSQQKLSVISEQDSTALLRQGYLTALIEQDK